MDNKKEPPSNTGAKRVRWPSIILAIILGLGAIAALHASGKFLRPQLLIYILWLVPVWILIQRAKKASDSKLDAKGLPSCGPAGFLPLTIIALLLILSLFSGNTIHCHFFFPYWGTSDPPVSCHGMPMVGWFALGTAMLTPFFLERRRSLRVLLYLVFAAFAALSYHGLLTYTEGQALYDDDHPSMMFRLVEITNTWPQLLNYIPWWNGGVVHFTGITSGLNGLALIFKPFLAFFDIQTIYTPILGLVFTILVPLLAAVSIRVYGGSRTAAVIGATLSLGVSYRFFLWLLHFGTVGSTFAIAFALPFSAAAFRILCLRRTGWRIFLFLVFSFCMLMMWPSNSTVVCAVFLAALCSTPRWTRRTFIFTAAAGIVSLILMSRHLGVLYFEGGNDFFSFLLSSTKPAVNEAAPAVTTVSVLLSSHLLSKGWANLLAYLHEINPVLIFLGALGAAVFPVRSIRRWFIPIFIFLALVIGWLDVAEPNLQIGRMSIALAFLAVAPASLALERLLRSDCLRSASLRAALVSLLIISALTASLSYSGENRLAATHVTAKTTDLVDFIKKHTKPGERVMFAGMTIHAVGDHGHIAFLPLLTGREMMASDYYPFYGLYPDLDYPPRDFRWNAEQIHDFANKYNIHLVVTIRPESRNSWRTHYDQWTNLFPRAGAVGDLVLYEVSDTPSTLFLEGTGTIAADYNKIRVTTENPDKPCVIKYTWQEGLSVKAPVEIKPYPLSDKLSLIQVNWNGQTSCDIRFSRGW